MNAIGSFAQLRERCELLSNIIVMYIHINVYIYNQGRSAIGSFAPQRKKCE